jgi:hypothetical protein
VRQGTHITTALFLCSLRLLFRTGFVGIESCFFDGGGGVVGAGFGVFVGEGREGVFVLGVFAGGQERGSAECTGFGDGVCEEWGAEAGGEERAAEEHCCRFGVLVWVVDLGG